MAEFEDLFTGDAEFEIKTEAEAEASCVISDVGGAGGSKLGLTIKKLLQRIQLLEQQVASCVENQSLLYQVIGKCNVLEQRLKAWRKEIDGRLAELSRRNSQSGQREGDHNSTVKVVNLNQNCRAAPHPKPNQDPAVLDQDDLAGAGSDTDGDEDLSWEPDDKSNSNSGGEAVTSPEEQNTPTTVKPTSFPQPPPSPRRTESLITDEDDVPVKRSRSLRVTRALPAKVNAEEPSQSRTDTNRIHRKFPCPDGCGLILPTRIRLKHHLVSCRGLRPYKCDECEKNFQHLRGLKEHKKFVHRKERNADCPVCGRSIDKYALRNHMLLHGGGPNAGVGQGKRHLCETCGIGFVNVGDLRMHRRTHTGERPFTCPHSLCNQRFISKAALQQHVVEHTGRPLVCDECGRAFRSRVGLKKHKLRHEKKSQL